MRKILYISGTRADYGPARRLLLALQNDNECELSLIVTGMHLDAVHGETWREIERDGLHIAERLYGRVAGDSLEAMVASIGLYLYGMSQIVARLKPDIVLVLGDRGEQLAGAMAAAFQNIAVVHLCGGAISGSIDDSIRHAITKFAHYHLPGFDEHARRIEQLGEDPDSIQVVGLPGGDISHDVSISRVEICQRYDLLPDSPYLLVVQHPETHTHAAVSEQIEETLAAIAVLPYPALLANPNDDAGGREILACMQGYASRYPDLHLLPPPASREVFASIMAHAGVLVGNSSSALVEAMSVGVPVVNIGDRQRGREHLAHWINVKYQRDDISRAITQTLNDETYIAGLSRFSAGLKKRQTEAMILDFLKAVDLGAGHRDKPFFGV